MEKLVETAIRMLKAMQVVGEILKIGQEDDCADEQRQQQQQQG